MRARYILRNITKRDINLGDLRYKIPAGQCRDLYSKTAHLDIEDIEKSVKEGSISKYLGKSLVEVYDIHQPKAPLIYVDDMPKVKFPRHLKSRLVVEVGDIEEEMQKITINEEEEFLKELDSEDQFMQSVPVVAKKEDADTEE